MGNKRVMSEKETFAEVLALARNNGVEGKVLKIVARTKDAIKGVYKEEERQLLASMAIAEIHKTIGCVGPCVVDGVQVLPEETAYKEDINLHKGLVRLD
jgi:CTP synthase (UTP-ammonia lyase)